jgi:hypothetical protein
MNGITLPIDDPFWDSYYPPNGWNCRCTVVQVRKAKYPATDPAEAQERAKNATASDRRGMFRFNPGKEQATFPRYNPYTISRCRDCDRANGKSKLGKAFVNEGQLCEACAYIRSRREAEATRKLSGKEREQIRISADEWAKRHLPPVTLEGNQLSRQLKLTVKETADEILVRRKFFGETYAKNKYNPRLAETMELSTLITEWLPSARYIGLENGRDHNCTFKVFETTYNGVKIEFKVRVSEGNIIHTMKIKTD